jgi:hypothetical protein
MTMKEFMRYYKAFLDLGGKIENVQRISAHWLYGTDVESLASMSKYQIIYNPPGH